MARLYLTVPDEVKQAYQKASEKSGLSGAKYLEYLLGKHRDIRPPVIRYREMIAVLSDIERDLKLIAIKDGLSELDRIQICEKIRQIEDILVRRIGKEKSGNKG